jgi:hypothetical protein
MEIRFVGPSYTSRSENYAASRCINYYLETGKGKKSDLLIGCPGLTSPWITLSGGGMRGAHQFSEEYAIKVCGTNVYSVTTSGTTSLIGAVGNDGRPVQIASNGTNILVCSDDNLYAFTIGGSSATLVRTGVSSVDFLDGYFTITDSDTGRFYVSAQYATSIDELDFATAEGLPDNLVSHCVSRRTVYLFGTRSLEQWYNAGAADFPLARIDGAFVELGLIAKDSLAEMDAPFWLGGNDRGAGSVWTINAGVPRRISTPAVEYAIAQWPDMSDAYAFTYAQEGHSFYVISSVSGNETWAYDIAENEWHQRAYLHASGDLHRIRPVCHLYFAGRNLVGDWENGNVYEYDLDTFSDNGNPLPAIRSCPTVQDDLKTISTGEFRLDMDVGVGLTTGQGSDPQAMLRYSGDGGKTWSSSLWRTFGRIGEYGTSCFWTRVGGGERMVFEVTITDPVKRCISGAYFT